MGVLGFTMGVLDITQFIINNNEGKLLLSKKQTAAELNVSEATVDRLRHEGDLKSTKLGGQIFVRADELAQYIIDKTEVA